MIYKGTPCREEMKCQWGISLSDWFKTIVKQLHQEISFFEVTVSKDGLEFQAMNPSMSSLVRLRVPKGEMDTYDPEDEHPFYVEVDLFSKLCKVETGTVTCWDVDDDCLRLVMGRFNFLIPLIDIDQEHLAIPDDVLFNLHFSDENETLNRLIKCASTIQIESLQLTTNGSDSLKICMQGDNGFQAETELEVHIDPPSNETYSIGARLFKLYLRIVLGGSNLKGCMAKEKPFGLSSCMGDCEFHAFLAPRIDD